MNTKPVITREEAVRLGVLTRILQRAECIEEDERIVDLELDLDLNLVTLYLQRKEQVNEH